MSIELLIKLHSPKAVSIEAESQRSGRSPDSVGREEVLAALAHAERLHSVGVKVVRARHLADGIALRQLVTSYPISAVMSVAELNGDSERLLRLYKRHHPYGRREAKRLGSWSYWGISIMRLGYGRLSSPAVSVTPRVGVARHAQVPGNSPSRSRTPARTATPGTLQPRH
ncbi:hypothetical protein ACSZND_03140 [Aeromonas hydrophila]